MADSMDRVEETGFLSKKSDGFITASRAKNKDGDESVAMAGALGSASDSWMEMLNDGTKNPYPTTSEALKTKNTRKNNDSFS
jgi:hypothetical protein